jgi:hypothetical protein
VNQSLLIDLVDLMKQYSEDIDIFNESLNLLNSILESDQKQAENVCDSDII